MIHDTMMIMGVTTWKSKPSFTNLTLLRYNDDNGAQLKCQNLHPLILRFIVELALQDEWIFI